MDYQTEFEAAASQYYEAAEDYDKANRKHADIKYELVDLKERAQSVEDNVLLLGGSGEVVIDGKNAETRAAQLRMALSATSGYEAVVSHVKQKEMALATADANRAEAANRMSLYRRSMEFVTAATSLEAAVVSNEGLAREAIGATR